MADLTVSVVSADQEIWSGTASMVVARTTEGEIGILPGHEPILAILQSGEVRVTVIGGGSVTAQADDGFLSVSQDVVTIVARDAGFEFTPEEFASVVGETLGRTVSTTDAVREYLGEQHIVGEAELNRAALAHIIGGARRQWISPNM